MIKGKELIQFLGYSVDHPEFVTFLQTHEADIHKLPSPQLPEKKGVKPLIVKFHQGFILNFDRYYPGSDNADSLIKRPIGNGPIYLAGVNFFKPDPADSSHPDPVQLPFGLHFLDNEQVLSAKFGHKNIAGTTNSPYYEADESDYYYKSYHLYAYYDRGDIQEKLQGLLVSLR